MKWFVDNWQVVLFTVAVVSFVVATITMIPDED